MNIYSSGSLERSMGKENSNSVLEIKLSYKRMGDGSVEENDYLYDEDIRRHKRMMKLSRNNLFLNIFIQTIILLFLAFILKLGSWAYFKVISIIHY